MFAAKRIKKLQWILTTLMVINLAGCATAKDPQDPLESLNRPLFKFNTAVDKVVYRPVAKTYNFIVPNVVQARVTNFFNNIDGIPSVANDALQLNVYQTLADFSRLVVNSTVGIGGLFDPATKINLPLHHNDFGLTMARYGWKKSAYFVIPFVGPSTIRDGLGMPPNIYMNIWPYINPLWISYATYALNKIDQRAALLPTDKLVDTAFDPYVFVRDAYLQYRQGQINDLGKLDQTGTGTDTFVAGGPTSTSGLTTTTSTTPASATKDSGDTFVSAGPDNTSNSTANNQNPTTATTAPKPTGVNGSKAALEAQADSSSAANSKSNSNAQDQIKKTKKSASRSR